MSQHNTTTQTIYYHTDIALRYFPDSPNKKSAGRKLSNWIKKDLALKEQLLAVGYFGKQRIFTPKQMQILYEHLGEP
jgi:hypothetical protein